MPLNEALAPIGNQCTRFHCAKTSLLLLKGIHLLR